MQKIFISKKNDQLLREHKRVSSSPDYWQFFRRYDVFNNVKFQTHNGQAISISMWTLQDHFTLVGIV